MIFFLNLIFSITYCDTINRYNHNIGKYSNFCLYLPLLCLWTLVCGSQYNVGTDYFTYIDIFNGNQSHLNYFKNSGEFGFVYFVNILNYFGITGQDLFYIIYFISFILLYKIIKENDIKYWGIFVLLYIVETSLFNNQLNIIRQSFSLYIGTYAVVLINCRKRLKGVIFILIASTFHISALLFLIFLFCPRLLRHEYSKTQYLFLILSCLFLGGVFINISMFDGLIMYLPKTYAWYLQNGSIDEVSVINRLTKYIYIPLYIISIYYLPKYNLSKKELWLFNWGIIGFSFKLLVLNLQILNRISFIFLIVSIYPLFYLIKYLIETNRKQFTSCIYTLLILFYGIKVLIFPSNEYLYDSVFFHILD